MSKLKNRRDLPKYLYYYAPRDCYRFKLKGMDKFRYLPQGLSKEEAVRLFAEIREQFAERVGAVGHRFTDHAMEWRKTILPNLLSKRSKRPVTEKTRFEYARVCERIVEASPHLAVPTNQVTMAAVHRTLSPLLDRPSQYNRSRVVMTHIFRMCVKKGLADANLMLTVEGEPVAPRVVYLKHEHLRAIREAALNEWDRRVWDLLYFVSGRPTSVLGIHESAIQDGTMSYDETKTATGIDLTMNEALAETVEWFIDIKRRHNIISPHLVVHAAPYLAPQWRSRLHGTPPTEEYVSKRFAAAVVRAGFAKGSYRLYDLRKKGINDEVLTGGEQNKGAHADLKTRDDHYVALKPRYKQVTTLRSVE